MRVGSIFLRNRAGIKAGVGAPEVVRRPAAALSRRIRKTVGHAGRSCAERFGLLPGRERIDNRVELTVEDLVKLMERQVDPMVGDSRLRKIVGPDTLRTVATADHRTPRVRNLGILLGPRHLEQPGAQNLERPRLVLMLRLLVA